MSTYVFPLDKHQILWQRSSTVAWYDNGVSIVGYQTVRGTHCNTKGSRVLLLLNILRAGLKLNRDNNLDRSCSRCWSYAPYLNLMNWATCAFLILASVMVIFAHQTSNVPVELCHSHRVLKKNPLSLQKWSRNKKHKSARGIHSLVWCGEFWWCRWSDLQPLITA